MTDLQAIVDRFSSARVLLLGDTILDIYTYGHALGLSAETPTIVARRKEVKHSLGGAALVCRNILELGAEVQFITLIGGDEEAAYVRAFSDPKLTLRAVSDPARPTTVKHRFWVDGYKLFQLDQRDDRGVEGQIGTQILQQVDEALAKTDIVVVSDYRHGLLPPFVVKGLLERVHAAGKPVYVDSQVSQTAANHTLYTGGCIFCLNLKEARCIDAGFTPSHDPASFAALNRALDTDKIIVKIGSEGALFQNGSSITQAPANKVTVADTTGAGDSFLSAFCLAGIDHPYASLRLANAWAGLAVQIHGTAPPKKADLAAAVTEI